MGYPGGYTIDPKRMGGDFSIVANAMWMLYFRDEPLVIAAGTMLALGTSLLAWTDATLWREIASSVFEPVRSQALLPGSTTTIEDDPLILDSGILIDTTANASTVLWTDAPRCPQQVPTLLWITP